MHVYCTLFVGFLEQKAKGCQGSTAIFSLPDLLRLGRRSVLRLDNFVRRKSWMEPRSAEHNVRLRAMVLCDWSFSHIRIPFNETLPGSPCIAVYQKTSQSSACDLAHASSTRRFRDYSSYMDPRGSLVLEPRSRRSHYR